MRMQALSLKLLDIITLDKSNILTEEINTKEMSEDIENTIKLKMKDSSINVDLTFEDEYIHVDYDLFKSVIINLIDNSVKAKADEIKVNGIKRDDSFIIEVKDNGMGIPENELGRVKEAFYMVDKSRSRSQHGAGLGLALCDRIVKLHNGKLEIESQEGEGTTVSIILQL
jgi:signal transduction histidine kinase